MNVMLLAAGSVGHTQRWANGLVNAGLGVICVSQHEFLAGGWDSRVVRQRISHAGAVGYLINGRKVAKLFRRHDCTLLNAHYATGYGALATLSGIRPRVVSVWGSDVYDFPSRSPVHRALVRHVLRSADAVASTSEAMGREVAAITGHLRHPVEITPFGVETSSFHAMGRSTTREGGTIAIGTVKTLAHCYGIDTLIDAFALLRKEPQGQQLRLRIVGDGPERLRLEARARPLGDAVQFVGAVPHDEVPRQLGLLDIYVAPSRIESFGVAVVEASACELPVVVADTGGLTEVVDDGVTGLVVEPDSPLALAKAIARLVHDAEMRDRLGRHGRRRVKERYEWTSCVARMVEMYANVHTRSTGAAG